MSSLNLNVVDVVLLAILFLSILIGFWRGFVGEFVALITLVAAVIIAVMFTSSFANVITNSAWVQNFTNSSSGALGDTAQQGVSYIAYGISFFILFVGTLIVGAIIKSILNLAFQSGVLGFTNRFLGAIFGLVRGLILVAIIIFLVQLSPYAKNDTWQNAALVASFQPIVVWLGHVVSPALSHLEDSFNQSLGDVSLLKLIHRL